jgi:ferrous iron transport protein B
MPSLKLIWHTVYSQAKSYLSKAGTFILAASMVVWFASNYPKSDDIQTPKAKLEQSYLGEFGKATEPFFEPLGFDWRMGVSLEAGLAAKEVVVSTLGVLYADDKASLPKVLKEQISLPSAIAFIVFVMLYMPCFAASAVFTKEAGGWRYLVYLFIMTTITAWLLSFIAYNITKIIIGG